MKIKITDMYVFRLCNRNSAYVLFQSSLWVHFESAELREKINKSVSIYFIYYLFILLV